MKYIIDTEILEKEGIELDEALYLLSVYKKKPINFNTTQKAKIENKILKFDNPRDPVLITPKGTSLIETILAKSKIHISKDNLERYKALADKMREVYPKGLKPGTNYQWRDSTGIIADRLIKLVAKYNIEFTDEEAVDATQRYIASFNGNYKYMQILKYFISKQKPVEGAPAEQNSQFLSFLQNKEGDNVIVSNQDWTANLV